VLEQIAELVAGEHDAVGHRLAEQPPERRPGDGGPAQLGDGAQPCPAREAVAGPLPQRGRVGDVAGIVAVVHL